MLRVLHVAGTNLAGIPGEFVAGHRERGNVSELVTFGPSPYGFHDGICLRYPLFGSSGFLGMKKALGLGRNVAPEIQGSEALDWKPRSLAEKVAVDFRDGLWERRARKAMDRFQLWDYDLLHLDGGICFTYRPRLLRELRKRGKRFFVFYYGSDLRVRGLLPGVEDEATPSLTCEFDLLERHSRLRFMPQPFDGSRFIPREKENATLRICHSPTNRAAKGSDVIIAAVRKLERSYPVKLVLIEGLPHRDALGLKATCDLAIEQVGNRAGTGYGMNSIETLAMGIPTLTEFTQTYAEFIPDHPFILVTERTLEDVLVRVIKDPEERRRKAREGRAWVLKTHDRKAVMERLYGMYREMGIVV